MLNPCADASDPSTTTLRTSSYTIFADLPNKDEVLLVHGYTGAYDKVSASVADYVYALQKRPHPRPLYGQWSPDARASQAATPSPTIIEQLTRRGYLTTMSPEGEESYFVGVVNKLHHIARQLLMPSYILMPTYDCNLRCAYCFQDFMRTDSRFNHLLRMMSRDQVDRIFDAMVDIEYNHGINDDSERQRVITLFGGEPLLLQSRPLIEYIMRKAQATGGSKFLAVTNGTDLHHFADLLGPDGISVLQITIDGPPREHDKRRIGPDGSGSFDEIAKNVSMALDRGAVIDLRMNVDRTNIQFLPELAQIFEAQGWATKPNFRAYATPVHATNGHTDKHTTFNSWELNEALDQLRVQYPSMVHVSRPNDGLSERIQILFESQRNSLPDFKSSYCGAHNRMYIFDAFGDIYACWERTGDSKIRIGHIAPDGKVVMNATVNGEWRNRNVASNPTCRQCRFALFCGGGCAVLAEGASGTMYSNYCDGFGKRFRASVAQAYQNHVSGIGTSASEALPLRDL